MSESNLGSKIEATGLNVITAVSTVFSRMDKAALMPDMETNIKEIKLTSKSRKGGQSAWCTVGEFLEFLSDSEREGKIVRKHGGKLGLMSHLAPVWQEHISHIRPEYLSLGPMQVRNQLKDICTMATAAENRGDIPESHPVLDFKQSKPVGLWGWSFGEE